MDPFAPTRESIAQRYSLLGREPGGSEGDPVGDYVRIGEDRRREAAEKDRRAQVAADREVATEEDIRAFLDLQRALEGGEEGGVDVSPEVRDQRIVDAAKKQGLLKSLLMARAMSMLSGAGMQARYEELRRRRTVEAFARDPNVMPPDADVSVWNTLADNARAERELQAKELERATTEAAFRSAMGFRSKVFREKGSYPSVYEVMDHLASLTKEDGSPAYTAAAIQQALNVERAARDERASERADERAEREKERLEMSREAAKESLRRWEASRADREARDAAREAAKKEAMERRDRTGTLSVIASQIDDARAALQDPAVRVVETDPFGSKSVRIINEAEYERLMKRIAALEAERDAMKEAIPSGPAKRDPKVTERIRVLTEAEENGTITEEQQDELLRLLDVR